MSTIRQAGCVAIGGRGVLIEGEPGTGKTSLALALIDRGATLVSDDCVEVESRVGRLWASPPPNISGKIEIRNVGIVQMQAVDAPICLRVVLHDQAPRFVERAESVDILECAVPSLTLFRDSAVLPLRVEYALSLHGLALPRPFNPE